MGSILQIPSADFSSSALRSHRLEKIELNDNDMIPGFLPSTNTIELIINNDLYDSDLSHYPAVNKFNSGVVRSSTNTFSGRCKAYFIDIPDGAIGVTGISQVIHCKTVNFSHGKNWLTFATKSGVGTTNTTHSIISVPGTIGQTDGDSCLDIMHKVETYNRSLINNVGYGIQYIKSLDIFDDQVFLNDSAKNQFFIGLYEVVMKIKDGSEYLVKQIIPPCAKQSPVANGSTFKTGFIDSHLYWIFE